ncbi:MAG: amidohydrolase family protein [Chloroflexi bacterium]|nr:amidohydrolase family protein [Chloroflexota bacterium]
MTRIVFRGGTVFDGTGAAPAAADVVLEDGRIVDVGSGLDGDEAIDAAGRTILPGFFDCHVHVILDTVDVWRLTNRPYSMRYYVAARNLAATLATGITSIRDAGGADLGIKEAVRDGLIGGPRMQVSLTMLSQTGGHSDDWYPSGSIVPMLGATPGVPGAIVDGPDEMRRKVRELHRMGADVVKVATSGGVLSARDNPAHAHFRPAELEVLVEEATAAGMFVMAHAQAADGIRNAVRAGIRSIEHGVFLDDEGIELMLRNGTWLVPTLVAPLGVVEAAEAGAAIPANVLEKAIAVIDVHRSAVRRAIAAGVRVAMGTDSGVTPHGRNLRELALMAELGMAPGAVLEATTRSAAQLLGVTDDRGTIEPGKAADLVLVAGDPYEFGTLADRIEAVWLAGRRVA